MLVILWGCEEIEMLIKPVISPVESSTDTAVHSVLR